VEDFRVDDEPTVDRNRISGVCVRAIESQGTGGPGTSPQRIESGTEIVEGEDRLLDASMVEVLDGAPGTSLARGSQAYRVQQTQKRRDREARQAEFKREMMLREATEITTVIFRGEKFQTPKFTSYPSELLWRHFHRWVRSFSGIQREDQKFAKFDDYESTALGKFQDPKSESRGA
jgi:hypothetical protein